jgi:hypothetical protein
MYIHMNVLVHTCTHVHMYMYTCTCMYVHILYTVLIHTNWYWRSYILALHSPHLIYLVPGTCMYLVGT